MSFNSIKGGMLYSLLLILFPFNPVIISLLSIILLGIKNIFKTESYFLKIGIIISITMALIAYTQQSTATSGDTDINRYYSIYSKFYDFDITNFFLLEDELLTFTFSFINILVVKITHNVQYISLIWTFFIYFFILKSIENITRLIPYLSLNTSVLRFLTIILLLFGTVLFTQVTETIKSAASIAFFFFIFTDWILEKSLIKTIIYLFLCIGIHSQCVMLMPLFLFNKLNSSKLLILVALIIFLSPLFNIIDLSLKGITHFSGWVGAILERAQSYAEENGEFSSKRYIFELLLIFLSSILILRSQRIKYIPYINIIFIYIGIAFFFFNNSNAFIRFANFSTFISTMTFLMLYKTKNTKSLALPYFIFFLILNFQMTYGRLFGNWYTSSYVDNSLTNLLTFNILDYLTFKAY